MRRRYRDKAQVLIDACQSNDEVFRENEITDLPEPLQRYFRYSGYIGKKKRSAARLVWKDVLFRMSPEKPWINVRYEQYNFVRDPARLAYIRANMLKLIPFEGIDSFVQGRGNMLGKIMSLFKVFDVTGSAMNVSAAVTFLSEVLFVPSCAFTDYIRWQAIDQNSVKGIFEYNSVKAEGIFTFNDIGEMILFTSKDRYMDTGKGNPVQRPWSVIISEGYQEKDGIKIPTRARAVWQLLECEFEYFSGALVDAIHEG